VKEIRRGDIFYADLDPTVGSEQHGVRPVLILQNDVGNRYSSTVIVAVITSKKKNKLPTHVAIEIAELPQPSFVLLEQIRTIDKQRLGEFVGVLRDMGAVEGAVRISLGIKSQY